MKSFVFCVLLWCVVASPFAGANGDRMAITLYHFNQIGGCDYENNPLIAFKEDLETAYKHGWKFVPLQHIVEVVKGKRKRSSLSEKIIAWTGDDGPPQDLRDIPTPCGIQRSALGIIEDFIAAHPEILLADQPEITFFVIASPVVRQALGNFPDNRWYACQNQSNSRCKIGNHSADHNAILAIKARQFDEALQTWVLVCAERDKNWDHPARGFMCVNDDASIHEEIFKASIFISTKINVMPRFLAYPYGEASLPLIKYLREHEEEHQLEAAFGTVGGLVTESSDPWNMERFVWGLHWTHPNGLYGFVYRVLGEPLGEPKPHPKKPGMFPR